MIEERRAAKESEAAEERAFWLEQRPRWTRMRTMGLRAVGVERLSTSRTEGAPITLLLIPSPSSKTSNYKNN